VTVGTALFFAKCDDGRRLKMGKYVKWIEYRGKKILYSDYSGLKSAEYEAAIEETIEELLNLPDGTIAASITNVKGTTMSNLTSAKGRQITALLKKKKLSGPTAVVGMSELVGTVARMMQPNVHTTKTVEEAKDWIVSQMD
jgi:hypothetical protein